MSTAKDVVEFIETPALPKLYTRAIGGQALARLGLRGAAAKEFPQTEFRLPRMRAEPGRLAAYQRLMRGAGRDEIPAGFLHIMSFPLSVALMSSEDFPVSLLGLVHLRNDVEQYRRVLPEEELNFSVNCRNPGRHRAGTQFQIQAEAHSGATDELLWRGASTYLSRGVFLDYPEVEDERREFSAPDANERWELSADIGRRYGAVSGDINPIHTSTLGAKALGMKTTIAHGMYLAGRALAAAQPAAAEAFRWSAEFATPTFIPGSVALRFQERFDASGAWAGTEYLGWNPRNGKKNFSGEVSPL
ncbi:MaoC/PaaZ C-terminal domain-containing protein [Acaricomes phytoseiuli]|uniref:MaoC/PaaZ C-terminal domain-containing protein n=1 Tax=Acaricomes phytoseiuli TaxID=291968 RepID=UPI002223475A|nr:MaoC/PaaZ C-terminal domain-containing protein [Acaricomes phytoseiuli]MCW1250292.1 MaoC/PaaZ C-terminal domain-containing protein [Acaricomes phytoseiuli]